MPKPLRPYQARAVERVIRAGEQHRRVCLVAPTGAGKTRLGVEFAARAVRRGRTVLWVCHRTELLSQAAQAVADEVGGHLVQCLEGDHPTAPVTVATVQQLAHRTLSAPGLLVLDEAHHYAADQWGTVARSWGDVPTLGLTATPERSDGRPLGDLFSGLVVAAHYSELLQLGYLVPCRVIAPVTSPDDAIAQAPVAAYLEHGEGRRGFVFAPTVDAAEELARGFCAAGVLAAVVSERTPDHERKAAIAGLGAGTVTILANVYALTEGVDVPSASIVILARRLSHVSQYLQAAGRVLRPAAGKHDALLIDLAGSALLHGLPTQDREYSLGDGIAPTSAISLAQCLACGYCWQAPPACCPRCGEPLRARTPEQAARLAIAGIPLADITATLQRDAVLRAVYRTVRAEQIETGRSLGWVTSRYLALTGERCVVSDATREEKIAEYARQRTYCAERGWEPGAASHRYRATFGVWPKGVRYD